MIHIYMCKLQQIMLYLYLPAMYKIVWSLSSTMSANVGLLTVLDIIPQLYWVSFLSSFIIVFSIIRLFPFVLYPVSMPLRNCCTVYMYTALFFVHAAVWLPDGVTVHNSSTSWPGCAMTTELSQAVTEKYVQIESSQIELCTS